MVQLALGDESFFNILGEEISRASLVQIMIDYFDEKLGEEATETVIAAKNKDKNELIGEICDLVYHTEVLMYSKGITLDDIKLKLTRRHKVERNKKQQNIRGNYQYNCKLKKFI